MRSSSVRLARRRFGGGGPPVSWWMCETEGCCSTDAIGETRAEVGTLGDCAGGNVGVPVVGLRVPGLMRHMLSHDMTDSGKENMKPYHRAMCASQ
jgi:hypothetical protein